MDLHIKIRNRRLELGYKSAELFAHEKKLNRNTYQRIEQGFDFRIKTLYKVAKALEIEPKELL